METLEDYHHRNLAFEEYRITVYAEIGTALAGQLRKAFLNNTTLLPSADGWGPSGYKGPMSVVSCETAFPHGGKMRQVFELRSVSGDPYERRLPRQSRRRSIEQ